MVSSPRIHAAPAGKGVLESQNLIQAAGLFLAATETNGCLRTCGTNLLASWRLGSFALGAVPAGYRPLSHRPHPLAQGARVRLLDETVKTKRPEVSQQGLMEATGSEPEVRPHGMNLLAA